jgi:putative transcriptional regulator
VSIPGVEINARIGLNFPAVIAGFVILVLAEVFRLGVELKEDQDLTV